jgi:hypothetical protein
MKTEALTSRLGLIIVVFLGFPAALFAQKQQGQWTDLRGLRTGQGIEVIETSMKHHGGEFVSVSDEMLTLQENGSDIAVKREDVVRVSTTSGARRGEHAVIVLLAGAAIGAATGVGIGSTPSAEGAFFTRGIGALVGIIVGAPTGAAIGALIPCHATIYRAAPAAAAH